MKVNAVGWVPVNGKANVSAPLFSSTYFQWMAHKLKSDGAPPCCRVSVAFPEAMETCYFSERPNSYAFLLWFSVKRTDFTYVFLSKYHTFLLGISVCWRSACNRVCSQSPTRGMLFHLYRSEWAAIAATPLLFSSVVTLWDTLADAFYDLVQLLQENTRIVSILA